ncbi:MAG: hypothetical protein GY847_29900 [Proteobacteria bacterium]|nr:hypothetical protein [Pseudomonadota bacterium]
MKSKNKMHLMCTTMSMLLVTVLTTSALAADWYWVPARITNGNKGATLLTSDPHGVIGTLLESIQQQYSHSGMFVDNGYNIAHNTADVGDIDYLTDSIGLPEKLNGAALANIEPGLIRQTTEAAFKSKEFKSWDYDYRSGVSYKGAAVLIRRDITGMWDWLSYGVAADQMQEYEAFYNLYSYTDIWTTEPDRTDPRHLHVAPSLEHKNMCSGTIAWALWRGGFTVWPVYYPAEIRDDAAPVLYSAVRSMVGKKVPGGDEPFLGPVMQILSSGTKARIANQVVNCMAFNDCSNTGDRWEDGVGDGWTIAPDNLLPVGYANSFGQYWGISGYDPNDTYTKWYDSVEPISYSGGYWKKY